MLILLSVLLLLVGGGFGPPLLGIIIGVAATRAVVPYERRPGRVSRALGSLWPWFLATGALGYLSLLPGVVLLDWLVGIDNAGLVYGLTALAFAGLILALMAARVTDRSAMSVEA